MFFELQEYFIPIIVAALAGGLIGIEREYHDKSAGFRTMILISIGSCLFTLMSLVIGSSSGEFTRIAAAVVSGVGFLGAGVIIKDGVTIGGLTTAAAIWLAASLGMAAGAGQYNLVLAVTIMALFVLWLFPPFERWLDSLHEFLEIHVTIKNNEKAEAKVIEKFAATGVKMVHLRRTRATKGERTLHIKIKTNPAKRAALSRALVAEKSIITFSD